MSGSTTRNLDRPKAGGLDVIEAQILDTEVARMGRATSKQETRHD